MSKASRPLEDLSKELSETVQRINQLQQKPPLGRRIANHISRQGSHLVGLVLAGALLSVALDRLAQKRSYEDDRQRWQQEQSALQSSKERLEREFQEALKGRSAIQNLIEEELSKEGRWLPSLATRLREGLDSLDATARRVAPQPGSRGVENVQEPTGRKGKSDPKLMI